jgi:hypothetical protein
MGPEGGVGKSTAVDYLGLQATFLCWGLRRSDKLGALLARAPDVVGRPRVAPAARHGGP